MIRKQCRTICSDKVRGTAFLCFRDGLKLRVEDLPALVLGKGWNRQYPQTCAGGAELPGEKVPDRSRVCFGGDKNSQMIVCPDACAEDVELVHYKGVDLVQTGPVTCQLDIAFQAAGDGKIAVFIKLGDIAGAEYALPLVSPAKILAAPGIAHGHVGALINELAAHMDSFHGLSLPVRQPDAPARDDAADRAGLSQRVLRREKADGGCRFALPVHDDKALPWLMVLRLGKSSSKRAMR